MQIKLMRRCVLCLIVFDYEKHEFKLYKLQGIFRVGARLAEREPEPNLLLPQLPLEPKGTVVLTRAARLAIAKAVDK